MSSSIPVGFLKYQGVNVQNVQKRDKLDPNTKTLNDIADACRNDIRSLGFTSDGQLYAYIPPEGSNDWLTNTSMDLYVKDCTTNCNLNNSSITTDFVPSWSAKGRTDSTHYSTTFPTPFPFTKTTDKDSLIDQLDGAWVLLKITDSANPQNSGYAAMEEMQGDRNFYVSTRGGATPLLLRLSNYTNSNFQMFTVYGEGGSYSQSDTSLHGTYFNSYNNNGDFRMGGASSYDWLVKSYLPTDNSSSYFGIYRYDGDIMSIWNYGQILAKNIYPYAWVEQCEIIVPPDRVRIRNYINNGRGKYDCCSANFAYSIAVKNDCTNEMYYPGGGGKCSTLPTGTATSTSSSTSTASSTGTAISTSTTSNTGTVTSTSVLNTSTSSSSGGTGTSTATKTGTSTTSSTKTSTSSSTTGGGGGGGSGGLNSGAIAGIVIGVIAFVAIVGGIIYFAGRKKKTPPRA